MSDMIKIQRALVSVSDKTGIVDFVTSLVKMDVEITSTGGTAKTLKTAGINVTAIDQVTGFPEMMDGRVKTLHPKIHGGLLALRDNPDHMSAQKENGIQNIDLVCVNLYPFENTIAKADCTFHDAIENIDIGGPSMVRSAAKNYGFVTIVTDPDQYGPIINEMKNNNGATSQETRSICSTRAFAKTASYDSAISHYLASQASEKFPATTTLSLVRGNELRYGENPHQKAAFYRLAKKSDEPSVTSATLLEGGKQISFNNFMDTNAAFELVKEFIEPAVVIVKHMNPCGVAIDDDIITAYKKAYLADVTSAFGGIIAINKTVTKALANAILESYGTWGKAVGAAGFFAEVIIAPSFDDDAIDLIRNGAKKWARENVRLLTTGSIDASKVNKGEYDVRCIAGGMLLQERDLVSWEDDQIKTVTRRHATIQENKDLKLAWIIAKHVKSNTIVLAKKNTAIGIGAGQMNRVDSGMLAIRQAGEEASGSVMASDAFFPFPDNVTQAAKAGITAVVQPGGSQNDQRSIDECNNHDMAMVFTGKRHFKH